MTTAPRVLVTGAKGFIGRGALAPLRRRGFEVHAVARALPDAAARDASPGVTWHAADLLVPGGARAVLEAVRPSHLLHFAWYAEHGKFWTSPLNLTWLAATLSLLRDFAEAGGTRFVGAGTCAEYDWSGDTYDEATTPLRPATLYGAAKSSAFLTGEAFAKTAGIEFAWGRIFHLFGPGEAPGRIIPTLLRAHLQGGSVECGPGNQQLDFLPSASVADAFAHLCASDARGAINIGTGQGNTLREISAKIAALNREINGESRGEVRFGVREESGPARLVPTVARLSSTGWLPPESLETGLKAYLESERQAPRV
jgi:nucleoside-diphosphate-sugar epimerase